MIHYLQNGHTCYIHTTYEGYHACVCYSIEPTETILCPHQRDHCWVPIISLKESSPMSVQGKHNICLKQFVKLS